MINDKLVRIISTIATLIAALFNLTLLIWSLITMQPLVLPVVALSLTAVFVYFLYIDYKYFFISGEKENVTNSTDEKM